MRWHLNCLCVFAINMINVALSFKVQIIEKNGDNYLSAGQIPLPMLYVVFSLVYFAAGCFFCWVLRKSE